MTGFLLLRAASYGPSCSLASMTWTLYDRYDLIADYHPGLLQHNVEWLCAALAKIVTVAMQPASQLYPTCIDSRTAVAVSSHVLHFLLTGCLFHLCDDDHGPHLL
jgi:hypothetical protein